MSKEVALTDEVTEEELVAYANDLLARADSVAQMAAAARGKGYAIVSYPDRIPELDRQAAEALQKNGHDVGISKGAFLNTISFPGREVIRAR